MCVNVREFVGACESVLVSVGERVWESVFECVCKSVRERVGACESALGARVGACVSACVRALESALGACCYRACESV